MKKISLDQLMKESRTDTYPEQYAYICAQIEKQKIKPVKASPLNGKKPSLHLSYWLLEEVPDYQQQIEELKFGLVPAIQTDYYRSHLDVYQAERKWVKLLNHYLLEQSEKKPAYVSLNERSFQIWGREKFLQREQGNKVLAHCGITLEQLFVYQTTEPLAYYSGSRKCPQNVLILENKDTFYSMRRHFMNGNGKIFGEEIGTVIYGAGKGILRSFADFEFCVEPHINNAANTILYFGDLDYEGIGIYERLAECFGESSANIPYCDKEVIASNRQARQAILPFVQAYKKMLQKAQQYGMDFLPETSEKQNRHISGAFFSYFSKEITKKIKQILESGKYIPQEIINISDYYTT